MARVDDDAKRNAARELAAAALARGDATGWFEELYATTPPEAIPWAELVPDPRLVEWADEHGLDGSGRQALTVGSGFGDDAEHLAGLGFAVVAFDIAPTAIRHAQLRFPSSRVRYVLADVLATPPQWYRAFDFVLEAYTLQVLPPELRPAAARGIAETVAPGGTVLVLCDGRDEHEEPGAMPWPLTAAEVVALFEPWLEPGDPELLADDGRQPPTRRLRVVLRRPRDHHGQTG